MPINEQDYALVIGVEDYPDYTPLQGAKSDAQRFAEWLTDKNMGGGLPDDNCQLIVSSSNPVSPTFGEVDSKLSELRRRTRDAEKRRFYFYFAGHGQTYTSNELNLCLANWTNQDYGLRAAISYADWKTAIIDCTGFTEVFFFLDCCRIRVYGGGGLPCSLNCAKPHPDAGRARTFAAFATEFQNQAFEAERSGNAASDEPLYGGHFTEALITGLKGGAASMSGGVAAQDLGNYLVQWTPRIAEAAKHPSQQADVQFPTVPASPILGSYRPYGTLLVIVGQGRRGPIRILAPDDSVIHEAAANTSPWQLPEVRYGRYRIVDMDTYNEKEFDFQPRDALSSVTFD